MQRRAVVGGAGGFIGHHMVRYQKDKGYWVRGVDIKEPEYEPSAADEFLVLDLREWDNCVTATAGVDEVFQLAADMGGIGYITGNRVDIARNNVLINAHMLEAAYRNGVKRHFYSSSACIYPMYKQHDPDVTPLKEEDAYPAMPEDGYGWEKLFSERMCRHFLEDHGLITRVARYQNVYGPKGTYVGGREKAPAAICRKVAEAKFSGKNEIEIWGDGEQTRSFMYIDDCLYVTRAIMASEVSEPLNLGSDELVTVNQLVDIVEGIAGIRLARRYKLDAPQGVRGRNSDNTLILKRLGWAPSIPLSDGLEKTYRWIYDEMSRAQGDVRAAVHA